MCLLAPGGGKTCTCPENFVLEDNGVSCRNNCLSSMFVCNSTYKCIPFWWQCDTQVSYTDFSCGVGGKPRTKDENTNLYHTPHPLIITLHHPLSITASPPLPSHLKTLHHLLPSSTHLYLPLLPLVTPSTPLNSYVSQCTEDRT